MEYLNLKYVASMEQQNIKIKNKKTYKITFKYLGGSGSCALPLDVSLTEHLCCFSNFQHYFLQYFNS